MARKPYKGSTIDNVLKNGLGALNIDATRVPWADAADANITVGGYADTFANTNAEAYAEKIGVKKKKSDKDVRLSLLNHDHKTCGLQNVFKGVEGKTKEHNNNKEAFTEDFIAALSLGRYPSNVIGEVTEGYQKFFYNPKVSRKERHCGFDIGDQRIDTSDGEMYGATQAVTRKDVPQIGNNHPTVKPVALMEYLIKLVTPPSTPTLQRKVLDPFNGSGSTGMAATKLGHHYTGCDLDPKYIAISKTRIDAWNAPEPEDNPLPDNLFGESE